MLACVTLLLLLLIYLHDLVLEILGFSWYFGRCSEFSGGFPDFRCCSGLFGCSGMFRDVPVFRIPMFLKVLHECDRKKQNLKYRMTSSDGLRTVRNRYFSGTLQKFGDTKASQGKEKF